MGKKRKKESEDVEDRTKTEHASKGEARNSRSREEAQSSTGEASSGAAVHGFHAFRALDTLRNLSATETKERWLQLSEEQKATCANWESIVASTQDDIVKASAKMPADSAAASSATTELAGGESADSKDSEGSLADSRHDSSIEDDTDSTVDFKEFTTALHIFLDQESRSDLTDQLKLIRAFATLPLRQRVKLWNKAREVNLPDLERLKKTADKVKRLRAISVVTRFEMADRVQWFWEENAGNMGRELAAVNPSDTLTIEAKYKLRIWMGSILVDLWHLEIMENLSRASQKPNSGLRRLLGDSCFASRRLPSQPWGPSFVAGSFPTFDALRVLDKPVFWPRLCHSPFSRSQSKKLVLQPAASPSVPERKAAESGKSQRSKKLAEGGEGGKLDETSHSPCASVVSRKEAKGGKISGDSSFAAPPEKKRRVNSGDSARKKKSATKDNTFRAQTTTKRRASSTQSESGTSLHSFGAFSSTKRMQSCFSRRLGNTAAEQQLDPTVEMSEVVAPSTDMPGCCDTRADNETSAIVAGCRLFFEKGVAGCNLCAVQTASIFEKEKWAVFLSHCQAVASNILWRSSRVRLSCPDDADVCRLTSDGRNFRLGCWKDAASGVCAHAKSGLGDDLLQQLRGFSNQDSVHPQAEQTFIDDLLELDESLTELVERVFPQLARAMRQTAGVCRLRCGKSIFSTIALIGDRGHHAKNSVAEIGVRAIVNCSLEAKGKRKLLLPSFATFSSDGRNPLMLSLKHGNVALIPAKAIFALTRHHTLQEQEFPKCLTLQFSCMKDLDREQHGMKVKDVRPCVVVVDKNEVDGRQGGKTDESGSVKADGTFVSSDLAGLWAPIFHECATLHRSETDLNAVNAVVANMVYTVCAANE